MATAGDGAAAYEGGGAGGKLRKRPLRRSTQATPYERPPTGRNPSLFTKLVDPASRLIYAGAHRLFGAFRKRLPPIPQHRSSETYEEPRNRLQDAGTNNCNGVAIRSPGQGGDSASISAATEISELEQMLKQKTFTRSEIEHLTALLHSKNTESPSDHVVGRDKAEVPTKPHISRLEPSTSGTLKNHGDERDNIHAANSTPFVSSRVLEEDIASPAELAKAYMGTRSTKVAPSPLGLSSQALIQDSTLLNNTTVFPKTPIVSGASKATNSFRGLENGFTTPRSRGRSAMYSMARTPYSRGPSNVTQKGIKSDYGHGVASSHSAWGHEGSIGSNRMALKRRSVELDDDIRSGSPVRRIRQKANLLSHGSFLLKDKREVGPSANAASQKLLLMNEPEPKASKEVEEKGETSMHGSGYGSVPTKSSQMAAKILQQLDRMSPREKPSGSSLAGMREKTPSKLTSNMLHGQALKSLEKVDSPKFLPSPQDSQKSEGQLHTRLPDARESTSQSKDTFEENGPRKFAIPRNKLTSVSGDSMVLPRESASIATTSNSTLKLPYEPSPKRCAFQMSVDEDSFELDDDIHSNGHVSIPLDENKMPETSLVASKAVAADAPSEASKTSTVPEIPNTPALPEVTKTHKFPEATPTLPEVANSPTLPEFKKAGDVISLPKSDFEPSGDSVSGEQKTGYNLPTSLPSATITHSIVAPQSTTQVNDAFPEKDSIAFPSFGTKAEGADKVSPFLFSANEHSEPNVSSDAKPLTSTSVFNSATKNDQVNAPIFSKDDNGNGQMSVNLFGKPESSPSIVSASTSSAIFSSGVTPDKSNISNMTTASNPLAFSSSTPSTGTNTSKLFGDGPFSLASSATASIASTTAAAAATAAATSTTATAAPAATTATTTTSSSIFSTPTSAPIFSFGAAIATSSASTVPTFSVAGALVTTATDGKEAKSNNMSSSPFPSTSFPVASTGSSLFGFSSPASTSVANSRSQGSFFNVTSGSQTNIQPSATGTQVVPFKFGASTPSLATGTTGGTGSSIFGSSAPAVTSMPSFGLSSAAASSEPISSSSTSGSTTSVFGSTWQSPKSAAFGSTFTPPSTVFSFGASSTSMPSATSSPVVFGSSNTGASTGASMFSFTSAGPTNSSFPAPPQGQSPFGNPTPVFGAATASPNNNDQMSMEDNMAEDSMQTPTPTPVPAFGQAPAPSPSPGFMFGSTTPTPTPLQPTNPFQLWGQPAQPPAQNPFQASGSVEFNAGGGSFSLGSGGGDKSGRRILRVKNKNRRK